MRAPGQDAWLRWSEGVSDWQAGTYEFWFRPTAGASWSTATRSPRSAGTTRTGTVEGPHRWPIMRIQYASAEADPGDVVLEFAINENTGGVFGAWHRVTSTTPLELGRWYHMAAEYGPAGMKLFVNGRLEGSSDYDGSPEAERGRRPRRLVQPGRQRHLPRYQTAAGTNRGLCVREESWSTPTSRRPTCLPRRRHSRVRHARGHDQRGERRVRADAVDAGPEGARGSSWRADAHRRDEKGRGGIREVPPRPQARSRCPAPADPMRDRAGSVAASEKPWIAGSTVDSADCTRFVDRGNPFSFL